MSCFLLYFSRLVAYDFLYEKILRQRKSAVLFDKKTAFRPPSFHDLFSFTIYSLYSPQLRIFLRHMLSSPFLCG